MHSSAVNTIRIPHNLFANSCSESLLVFTRSPPPTITMAVPLVLQHTTINHDFQQNPTLYTFAYNERYPNGNRNPQIIFLRLQNRHRRPFAAQTGSNRPQYLITGNNTLKDAGKPLISENHTEIRGFSWFCQGSTDKKETGFRLSRMVREGGVEPPRPE